MQEEYIVKTDFRDTRDGSIRHIVDTILIGENDDERLMIGQSVGQRSYLMAEQGFRFIQLRGFYKTGRTI